MARKATGSVIPPGGTQRSWALRFRAYGKRRFVTLGRPEDGWTRERAETELRHVLADVERGIWQPHAPEPVAAPAEVPTFHEFASEWLAARAPELRETTLADYRWRLTHHLLPFFARHNLREITVEEVDRYRAAKVKAGELGGESINKTLVLLGAILEVAVEYGHIDRNAAKGKRRRVRVSRPAAVYLDSAQHIAALLEAASDLDSRKEARTFGRRPLIAALVFAGLRVGELSALRWRDVDLPGGRLTVRGTKTAAAQRTIDLLPVLRDELLDHRAAIQPTDLEAPMFPTAAGKVRDRTNIRQRVILPVVERADELLAEREATPLPEGLTAHKLRHTFASLLAACGEDPAYVMAQLGHTDPKLTLRVYTHQMSRRDGEKDRLRALVEGADWAETGRKSPVGSIEGPEAENGGEVESRIGSDDADDGRGGFRTCDLSRVKQDEDEVGRGDATA